MTERSGRLVIYLPPLVSEANELEKTNLTADEARWLMEENSSQLLDACQNALMEVLVGLVHEYAGTELAKVK